MRHSPADEDHRGPRSTVEIVRSLPTNLDVGTETAGVGRDALPAFGVVLEGDRAAPAGTETPLDGDAARSGSDVPQQFTERGASAARVTARIACLVI